MSPLDQINYFAETDYRGRRMKFGIKEADRAKHMYVIGKTGMGKSTLLENLAIQDIMNGNGIGFIDPHGSSAEELLSYIPEHRIKDVIYFAPFDQDHPIAFNVMEDIGKDQRALVASGLLGAFKKVWVDAWSPRMEYLLNNALLALLEYPDSTLLGINRMFADKDFRKRVVDNAKDPSVKAFWNEEYAKYNERYATEAAAAIQNKVGQFAANPLIRNMMGQAKSSFNIRSIMDEKKIFIANLSKGRIGEGNASLIGGMLITKLYLAAMSRADISGEALKSVPPFYLFVDEFQSFANESFADILSEARKYRLSLTIAHQYIEQMSDEVRAAVFGNVGTMVTFRVGAYDAEVLEKEFSPAFTMEDLVNLGFAQIYLKLMINGIGSAPFSAMTLPRPEKPKHDFRKEVIESSRAQFSRNRTEVEDIITKWHAPIFPPSEHSGGKKEGAGDFRRKAAMAPRRDEGYGAPRPMSEGERRMPREYHTNADTESSSMRMPRDVRVEEGREWRREEERGPRVSPVSERTVNAQSPTPPERVSLNQFGKKDKGPSEKNVSSLKEALAAVLKPAPQNEKTEEQQKSPTPPLPPPPPEKDPEGAPSAHSSSPKEVPEDILRNILK